MWHLVFKKNISLILSLNEITPWSTVSQVESKDKSCSSCVAERSLSVRKQKSKNVFEREGQTKTHQGF
jgi:hypothetical protein